MALDRHHFQLLAAIARHGQLGAAARALHLSPSAASHRIREAERRLGVTILEREGRVAKLSPAGRLLATAAQATERQLVQAEQASRWLTGPAEVERLRVGVGPLDTVPWFQQLFALPGQLGLHSIDLVTVNGGNEERALRANEIDLSIIASSERQTQSTHHLLATDHLVAVTDTTFGLPKGERLFAPHHLRGHDYLAVSFDPLPGWELDQFLDPAESEPRSLRLVDRASMLLELVAAGHGVSIQPSAVVGSADNRGRLRTFELTVDLPIYWYAVTGASPTSVVVKLIKRLLR